MGYFNEKTGLLCDGPDFYDSENNILWLSEYLFLLAKKDSTKLTFIKTMARIAVESISSYGKFTPAPNPFKFPEEGFSRDNMIAVTSMGLMFDESYKTSGIDFFDFPRYMQPQDICYFLYCFHWFFKPLITVTWISMFWSFFSLSLAPNGELSTDGRLLNFIRGEALSSKGTIHRFLYNLGQKISSYRIKNYFKKNPTQLPIGISFDSPTWKIIFELYFKDHNHPNNKLAEVLWQ